MLNDSDPLPTASSPVSHTGPACSVPLSPAPGNAGRMGVWTSAGVPHSPGRRGQRVWMAG